jgi:hypothetical protein
MNTMKCLDCGNTSKFVVPYIDRTLTTFNEQGDIVDEHSISYWSYDDERITCASEDCGSDNLNIYEEN